MRPRYCLCFISHNRCGSGAKSLSTPVHWLFSNKSTQSPTGFSPNPYDCRRFGNSAAPKTRIRLSGDFGGPMPTGLKGHQQLWSGCAAKPSERQSRPLGAATQPVTLNCVFATLGAIKQTTQKSHSKFLKPMSSMALRLFFVSQN